MSRYTNTFEVLDEHTALALALMSPSEPVEATSNQYHGSPHIRTQSISKFVEDGTCAAKLAMRRDLDRLVEKIKPDEAKVRFKKEMDGFCQLFVRFLQQQSETPLDWERIKNLGSDKVVPYNTLKPIAAAEKELCNSSIEPEAKESLDSRTGACNAQAVAFDIGSALKSLAVLKLNGGLGTTMGCVGPKSAIEVRDGLTFLDLTVRQIEWLNQAHDVDVPLILMNSFNTDMETKKIIQKYLHHRVSILTFNQSRFPRIGKDSMLPVPSSPFDSSAHWYPPGHGDVFDALNHSGLLDELLAQDKEYLFISNIDNLGATVDPVILRHMIESGADYIMEVTDKTKADVKGGTLIDYDGRVRLLEIAQVPNEHLKDFTSIKKFKIFNTNNIWFSLKALRRILDEKSLALEVIVNVKNMEGSEQKVIQLETAVGSAIKHFPGSIGVNVPRSRFLPVKSCSDLFLIQSDLYSLCHGELTINPKRLFSTIPLVKLGDHFKKVQAYLSRFAGPPHILELDHLTVSGDVTFGSDVTLKGTVIIVANHGCHIDIPSGSILHDKVVSGNLRILDH